MSSVKTGFILVTFCLVCFLLTTMCLTVQGVVTREQLRELEETVLSLEMDLCAEQVSRSIGYDAARRETRNIAETYQEWNEQQDERLLDLRTEFHQLGEVVKDVLEIQEQAIEIRELEKQLPKE